MKGIEHLWRPYCNALSTQNISWRETLVGCHFEHWTTHQRYRYALYSSQQADSPLDDVFDDPSEKFGYLLQSNNAGEKNESRFSESTTGTLQAETLPNEARRRRVRYSGKYPRNFDDKYKELSGDPVTVQKVLEKGMTPAGRHVPILLNECLVHLGLLEPATGLDSNSLSSPFISTQANVFYVDCTLGYGGHASTVLRGLLYNEVNQRKNLHHHLLCFDRDPIELTKATERLQAIVRELSDATDSLLEESSITEIQSTPRATVHTVHRNFCEIRSYLSSLPVCQLGTVTSLLADLGLSSMQIDNASRGFTYKRDGPLDMRMSSLPTEIPPENSTRTAETAYDLLSRMSIKEFTEILKENSDEEHADIIANAVLGKKPIPSTTTELAHRVRDAIRPLVARTTTKGTPSIQLQKNATTTKSLKQQLDSTVARVMQAIRIEINAEFESLEQLLQDLPLVLAPGGRAVFLTFHSGEDRRVKKAFKAGFKDGIYSSWSRDVTRPTANERRENPRSSCCKLRWVVRSDKILKTQ